MLSFLRLVAVVLVPGAALGVVTQQPPQECMWPGPPQFLTDRPSLPDSTMIRIGDTTVKVCYSRPSARGRVIFGELVPFERPWRTGANEPTLLHLPFPAEVAGAHVEPGRYLLLTVPGPAEWAVLLNTSESTTTQDMFADMVEVARGTAVVESLDAPVEVFTIRATGGDREGELILEWERTRVRIPIERRN